MHDEERDANMYALCGRKIRKLGGFGCMWVGVGGYKRVLETLIAPQLSPSPPQDTDAVEPTPSTTSYFPNPCVA